MAREQHPPSATAMIVKDGK